MPEPPNHTTAIICQVIEQRYLLQPFQLLRASQEESVEQAQRVAWYLIHQMTYLNTEDISQYFSQSSKKVEQGINKLKWNLPQSRTLSRWVASIQEEVKQRLRDGR